MDAETHTHVMLNTHEQTGQCGGGREHQHHHHRRDGRRRRRPRRSVAKPHSLHVAALVRARANARFRHLRPAQLPFHASPTFCLIAHVRTLRSSTRTACTTCYILLRSRAFVAACVSRTSFVRSACAASAADLGKEGQAVNSTHARGRVDWDPHPIPRAQRRTQPKARVGGGNSSGRCHGRQCAVVAGREVLRISKHLCCASAVVDSQLRWLRQSLRELGIRMTKGK